jgi:hypothetical protein
MFATGDEHEDRPKYQLVRKSIELGTAHPETNAERVN